MIDPADRRFTWPTYWHAVKAALLVGAVAYGLLLFPYVRALWWLQFERSVPDSFALPVDGVRAETLESSFGAPRANGPHEGIDVPAPAGTRVVAAADGVIIGNRPTAIGGNVLWIMGAGRRLYYYAHLRELSSGMHMGRLVHRGEPIGTVGNTGNAVGALAHLHFAIYLVASNFYPLRYAPVDPYPVLTGVR